MKEIVFQNRILVLILLLAVVSLLTYGNTLTNSFIYDDELVVKNNTFIRSWSNLPHLLRPSYFRASGEMSYRPVVTLSYFFDYFLWKLKPAGYHLTNVFFHTLNGVLLFVLVLGISGRPGVSFAAAALFIVHPVATEAVNGISFREDLMAATFFLSSFLLFLKISPSVRRQNLYAVLCIVSYLLALFSKEMAVTFPLILMLFELSFKGDFFRALREKRFLYSGLFLVLGFYLLVRFVLLRCPEAVVPSPPPFSSRMLAMSKVVFFYLKLLAFPLRLSAEYLNPVSSFLDPAAFLATAGLLLILLFSAANLRRFPEIMFGVWWFFLTFLPASNIIPLYNMVAERYLYLPLAGFSLAAAFAGETAVARFKGGVRRSVAAFLILLLCFCSGRTVLRNRDWKDLLTFCRKTLESCPESVRFRYNLGVIYDREGLVDEAISQFRKTLEKDPAYVKAHNNLGLAYRKKGLFEKAAEEFQAALKIRPRHFRAYNNLGLVYQDMGRPDEAIEAYQAALQINPDHVSAYNNLGLVYQKQGLFEKAIEAYRAALKINPQYARAYNNLGLALAGKQQFSQARTCFEKALALAPGLKEAKENIEKLEQLGY